ncbi:MAG TPA: S9 family peptidase [bacterium]|jgi:dipeptidyl aminopeptidase/acylaminoacyl peptidase
MIRLRLAMLALLAVMGLAGVSAVCLAQGTVSAPARTHEITLDDYFTQAFISDCAISPDGRYVVYSEMRWEPSAERRNTELWVVDTKSGESRRLTFDPAADSEPRWSHDSKTIYFLSSRGKEGDPAPLNKETQVWRVAVDGGEPQAVTRLQKGVSAYAMSRDGKTLYYSSPVEKVAEDFKDLREEYSKLTYGKGVDTHTQVWKLDLTSWRTDKLIDEQRYIVEFAVSPDEQKIAMITRYAEPDIWNEGFSRVDVYDAAAQKVTTLADELWRKNTPSPYGWLDGLTWSADSKKLAFRESFDGYPSELLVAQWNGATVQSFRLKRPEEFSLGDSPRMMWIGTSSDLCFLSDVKARVRVAVISGIEGGKQGAYRVLTPGDIVAETFSMTPDGKSFAAAISDTTHPADIYFGAVAGKGGLKRLTRVNPQIDTWKLPHIQVVSWKGAHGDNVEGILELPYDYKPGQKLPMHVALHGGPTDADHLYFQYWIYGRGLWASLGWAVFAPNYRGSVGYGDKFLTDLVGHENEIEVEDILTGVDAMVARGIADSSKLAVSGWSNGGYLTNCLITKTNRFKAASSGAGVLDMAMQWGTEDTPGHVINFQQGFPWSNPNAYRKASPLWDADKITTPTLIHVGEDDERVPAVHARTLFRALNFYRNIPSELVMYPGQGHGLMTYTDRKAKLAWDIAWFDKYVLGKKAEGTMNDKR